MFVNISYTCNIDSQHICTYISDLIFNGVRPASLSNNGIGPLENRGPLISWDFPCKRTSVSLELSVAGCLLEVIVSKEKPKRKFHGESCFREGNVSIWMKSIYILYDWHYHSKAF